VKKLEWAFKKAMETPAYKTAAESYHAFEENPLSDQNLKETLEKLYRQNKEIIPKIMSK
jgi:hypothetical protein